MKIPKYILHPSLLILAGLTMAALVWVSPSNDELNAPPSGYVRIQSIDTAGRIKLSGRNDLLQLVFEGSEQTSAKSWGNLNSHFRGLFVKTPSEQSTQIVFPLELYDPACFEKEVSPDLSCPVVITP